MNIFKRATFPVSDKHCIVVNFYLNDPDGYEYQLNVLVPGAEIGAKGGRTWIRSDQFRYTYLQLKKWFEVKKAYYSLNSDDEPTLEFTTHCQNQVIEWVCKENMYILGEIFHFGKHQREFRLYENDVYRLITEMEKLIKFEHSLK